MLITNNTIVAIATASGKGSVGIIRISGCKAYEVAIKITKQSLTPRKASLVSFYNKDNEIIDHGIVIYFKAPNSFTGEDIVEFQAHGGEMVLRMILKATLEFGCDIATPGEFSKRAFLNNKIDLAQAEAIADLIEASSEIAAKAAVRSLQGEFSKQINEIVINIINLRMHVEAAIDFPEEEINFLADKNIQNKLSSIVDSINKINIQCKQGNILKNGITVVIAGKPNAGKSSLLNALTGQSTAIVTQIAGTTRDILKENIQINEVPLHIIDTAGLRETNDIIEKEGISRAINAMENADHLLLVSDSSKEYNTSEYLDNIFKENKSIQKIPLTFIFNKADLLKTIPENTDNKLYISAKNKTGIDEMKNYLLDKIGYDQSSENSFIARERHINAIKNASKHLGLAQEQLSVFCGELMAEELLLAQNFISSITGDFSADDLLGEIFSSFCIGK